MKPWCSWLGISATTGALGWVACVVPAGADEAQAASGKSHAFRVVSRNGVPQLTQDGAPVRARIFWGAAGGGGATHIGTDWRTVEFQFTAPEDDNCVAMHLRFGEDSGNIWFDDVHVKDVDSGPALVACDFEGGQDAFDKEWKFWCEGFRDNPPVSMTVEPAPDGGAGHVLHVKLTSESKTQGFHLFRPELTLVKDHRYQVSIRVRADAERPFRPTFHHQGDDFRMQGGLPSPFGAQVALAAAQGVDLVSFGASAGWAEPGKEPNFFHLDRACREALAANPNALLLPRIGMHPPAWWARAHPDDVMRYEGGEVTNAPSVASVQYRADAAEALRRAIRYCEQNFGPHMAGYHPCGQNTGEWFYMDTWRPKMNGYEPATLQAWRAWLRATYATDEALRRAWNKPDAALDTVQVPTAAERHGAPDGALRSPQREQHLIDFASFQQENMADMVLSLARVIREEAGPNRLSLFFSGYVFEFATINHGPAVCGHYALRRLLDSPDIDILCSPISYTDRQSGGGAPTMTAAESVLLSGKLWLNEDDTRTYLAKGSRCPGWEAGADDLEQTLQQLRRNMAQEGCRNFATWWMDLGATGWFNDAKLWEEMGRFKAMEETLLANPVPFKPAVAAVLDERSMRYVAAAGASAATTRPLIYTGRANLHRMGTPFGQYLLDDVAAGRVSARQYVFLAAWALTGAERQALKDLASRASVIWCWAPGYINLDNGRVGTETVTDLTGFDVKRLPDVTPARVKATDAGLAAGLPAEFAPAKPVQPLLSPVPGPGDTVLAQFAGGEPAVVLRNGSGGPVLFVGTTEIPPALHRYAARLAGIHLYTETDANVYANGPFLAIHAAADGTLAVDTGSTGPVTDEMDGRVLGAGPRLELALKKGETRVLRLAP